MKFKKNVFDVNTINSDSLNFPDSKNMPLVKK